jgi:hypothetical protein
MASNPHLRQVPERLRVLASVPNRGPVRLLQLALVLLIGTIRLLAASQLARLSRDKATAMTVFLTKALGSPQSRASLVRKPSRFSLDPNVRMA